ncbi:MAG: hypothetical protein CMH03_10120 [Marinovum sp.]|nr:hypothetical protein [Marinovum sp.]
MLQYAGLKDFCPRTFLNTPPIRAMKLFFLAGMFFLIRIVFEPKLTFLILPVLLFLTKTLNFLTSPLIGLLSLTDLPLYFAIDFIYHLLWFITTTNIAYNLLVFVGVINVITKYFSLFSLIYFNILLKPARATRLYFKSI